MQNEKPIWLKVYRGIHDGKLFYPAEDKLGTRANLGDDAPYMIVMWAGELCVVYQGKS